MIRAAALLVLAAMVVPAAAQTEIPQSAFGIRAHTPVDRFAVDHVTDGHGIHVLEPDAVPVPLEGYWTYGLVPSPSGGVCDVIAHTPDLPPVRAGAAKARLYMHLSSRHGPPWRNGKSPPVHIWKPEDGTAKRIDLILLRREHEREAAFIRYYFAGPNGAPCYPGQKD